ncbi:MAG: hypothetical protein NW226_22750 [Microscillaceae bacterium]|nr:hypothetical protein [Microscillaceae bacterium]
MSKQWVLIRFFVCITFFQQGFAQIKPQACVFTLPFSHEDRSLLREVLIHLNYHDRVIFRGIVFSRCGEFKDEICMQKVDSCQSLHTFKISESKLLSYLHQLDQISLKYLETRSQMPKSIRFWVSTRGFQADLGLFTNLENAPNPQNPMPKAYREDTKHH